MNGSALATFSKKKKQLQSRTFREMEHFWQIPQKLYKMLQKITKRYMLKQETHSRRSIIVCTMSELHENHIHYRRDKEHPRSSYVHIKDDAAALLRLYLQVAQAPHPANHYIIGKTIAIPRHIIQHRSQQWHRKVPVHVHTQCELLQPRGHHVKTPDPGTVIGHMKLLSSCRVNHDGNVAMTRNQL